MANRPGPDRFVPSPPVRPPRPRPRARGPGPGARGSVAPPLVGLFLVLVGGFGVPWFGAPETLHAGPYAAVGIGLFFGAQTVVFLASSGGPAPYR